MRKPTKNDYLRLSKKKIHRFKPEVGDTLKCSLCDVSYTRHDSKIEYPPTWGRAMDRIYCNKCCFEASLAPYSFGKAPRTHRQPRK